jgi:hypothetical protein
MQSPVACSTMCRSVIGGAAHARLNTARLRIAVLAPPRPIYRELAEATVAELGQAGHHARIVSREPRAADSDLVILLSCWDVFERLLRPMWSRAARPKTVLWQLESLPPPDLSPESEALALRVTRWKWARLPGVLQLLKELLPMRTKILRGMRARELQAARRSGPNRADPFRGVHSEHVYACVDHWQRIRDDVRQARLDGIGASLACRVEFLASRGVRAELVPVGYHPRFGTPGQDRRDIDVVFIGGVERSMRKMVLSALQDQLSRRGITLLSVNGNCFGAERIALLRRARIALSFAQLPWEPVGLRLLLAASCGALVVSEPMADPAPYRPGRHFVQCQRDRLADTIAWYLDHESQRQALAASAFDFISREMTLGQSLAALLEL